MGLLRGLGIVIATLGALLTGVLGLLKSVLVGVGRLLRRVV
jgi:hypothetical protein